MTKADIQLAHPVQPHQWVKYLKGSIVDTCWAKLPEWPHHHPLIKNPPHDLETKGWCLTEQAPPVPWPM